MAIRQNGSPHLREPEGRREETDRIESRYLLRGARPLTRVAL